MRNLPLLLLLLGTLHLLRLLGLGHLPWLLRPLHLVGLLRLSLWLRRLRCLRLLLVLLHNLGLVLSSISCAHPWSLYP